MPGRVALLILLMTAVAVLAGVDAPAEKRAGDVAWEAGKREEALEHYQRAMAADPELVAARYNAGTVLLELDRPAEALPLFERVLQRRPGNADVLFNMAAAHRALGMQARREQHFDDARQHLERAVGLGLKDDVDALAALAEVQLGFGERGRAIAHLREAIAIKPDPELLLQLGMALAEDGRPDDALATLARVQGNASQSGAARFWSARALRQRRRFREALEAGEDAIRLGFVAPPRPYPLHAYLEVGLAHLLLQEPELALPYLELAVSQGVSLAAALEADLGVPPPLTADALAARLHLAPERLAGLAQLAAGARRSATGTGTSPTVHFAEEAAARGLGFQHRTARPLWYPPQIFGPGVALFDFDGDGAPDVYVPGSGEGSPPAAGALFRNDGRGRFEPADPLRETGRGLGAIACDLDNDGYPDLVVSGYRQLAIWWNNGDGTFRRADLLAPDRVRFFGGACALDYDRDGLPDLYVGAYSTWDADHPEAKPEIMSEPDGTRYLDTLRAQTYPAQADLLLHNRGARRFEDATRTAGIDDRDGRTLGVVALDVNGDGWPGVYTANDTTPNALWVNHGGRFTDEAARRWVNDARGSMGLATGDTTGRGKLDLFVTNWAYEANGYFVAERRGFRDAAVPAGLAEPSIPFVGWGAAFADLDDDGRLDLVYAEGHTTSNDYRRDDPALSSADLLAQPLEAFRGAGDGTFTRVSSAWGFGQKLNGRGVAIGDVDGDGALDVVVGVNNGPVRLYRNSGGGGGSARVDLVGTRSTRAALGTRLRLAAPDGRVFEAGAGGSYLSCHESVVHVGLGTRTASEPVEVRWPGGRVEPRGPLVAGRRVRLVEP